MENTNTNTNTTNTAAATLTRKVTITKDAAALAALLSTTSPLAILSAAMTVPAVETATFTDADGKVVNTTTRRRNVTVTMDDVGVDRKAAATAVKAIVNGNVEGIKALCKLFGVDCTEEDVDRGMTLIDKNFRTSCKGINGVMTRDKVVTLDSVLPVIRRIQSGDWSVTVWKSRNDYNRANGDRPVPVLTFKVGASKKGKA